MFKFANRGAMVFSLLLVVGFLTHAAPNRAEAGITGDLTVVNKTENDVRIWVNGNEVGVAKGPGTFTYTVGDDSSKEGGTKLQAEDGDGVKWLDVVTENANKVKWTLTSGGQSKYEIK